MFVRRFTGVRRFTAFLWDSIVKIRLNGELAEVPDAVTIEQLLARLGVDPRRVAVEHNLTIIKRHRQAETVVNDGDEVEIVNFVGGG